MLHGSANVKNNIKELKNLPIKSNKKGTPYGVPKYNLKIGCS